MIQIKDLGTFEAVPEIVIDIVKGNIKALENALVDGWDIHKPIQLDNYSEYSPLELALVINCLPSVQWLVEHGADLNEERKSKFLISRTIWNKKDYRIRCVTWGQYTCFKLCESRCF